MRKALLLFFIFSPLLSFADTPFPVSSSDIHLVVSESPYILSGSATIASGTSLTIDPGVIIKIVPICSIVIEGNLDAIGSADAPIIFTSIKNDSVGGDSNLDATSTAPALGDWLGLNISGPALLEHVDISYAINGISVNGGDLSVRSSNIHDNSDRGITVFGANSVRVTNSSFTNNRYPMDISTDIPFTHSGNSASGNQANAFAVGGHSLGDVHLTKDGIPYFTNGLLIASGTSLIVDSGVIIKMSAIASILMQGNLVLNGTKEEPVFITSVKDDSVSGDTNNNGAATLPAAGDWGKIVVSPGGFLDARYATVRYGGGQGQTGVFPNILNQGGSILLNNSSSTNALSQGLYQQSGSSTVLATGFGNQTTGVQIDGGEMTIHHSSFENNTGSAIDTSNITAASTTVDAAGNWWGSEEGPRHFPEKVGGTGQWINGDHIDFSGWLTGNPKSWNIDPVIIIPGILGSWKDWHGEWKLDPITHTYDNLVDTFKANGYVQGSTLYEFPYDWEKSNV